MQRFGHVTTQRVWLFVLCFVCVHRAGVRLGEVRDFMIRLLMVGNTAECTYCTVYLLHSVPTAVCLLQCAYCSVPTAVCLLQCAYCSVPTAQCAYCSVPTAVFTFCEHYIRQLTCSMLCVCVCVYIQSVTGGKEQTSGGCSLC